MAFKTILGALFTILSVVYVANTYGSVTYFYSGNTYTWAGDIINPSPYDISMRITGYIELDSIPTDRTIYLTPISYSFNDGIETYASGTSPPNQVEDFRPEADPATGELIYWSISIRHPGDPALHIIFTSFGGDEVSERSCIGCSLQRITGLANNSDPGTMSLSSVPVPPAVTGIWPSDAPIGSTTSLFVFGNDFDMTPGATQVYVNGIQQFLVQVVSPEMLIVRLTVTPSIIGGPVTVTTPNGSADSPTNFGDATTGLTCTGVWPSNLQAGESSSVFIFGSGFDAPGLVVNINGVSQFLVAIVSSDMLIVRVINPTGELSGPIRIFNGTDSVVCPPGEIIVIP